MGIKKNIKKEFVTVGLEELIPYENNPRKNEPAVPDVMASMEQCGDLDPIEVDENNVILSGHTRLLALKRLGETETEVVRYTGLTEKQKKKYRLLANKAAEKSEWDIDRLLEELDDLDFEGHDFGWELPEPELPEPGEGVREDDYDEELPEEPKSKVGQIFKLGRHRLMCGDSTIPENVQKLMGGAVADCIVTDPPYNVDYTGGTDEKLKILNDKMDDEHFAQFLIDAFTAAKAALKPGGAFYIWHADSEGYTFRAACHAVGWVVRQCLIWNKNALVMGRQDYQWKHEPCLYGWNDGAAHTWNNDRKQTTVIDYDKPLHNDIHPTMKPIGLFDI